MNRRTVVAVVLSVASASILSIPVLTATAATTSAPQVSIDLSGTVTDARAEQVSGGVTVPPDETPAVAGAVIAVNGTAVGRSDASGDFSFSYPDPNGNAVTVTVTAPGFGTYQLHGVAPDQSGDVLTVQLTGTTQALDAAAKPGNRPMNRATPLTSNCSGYSSNTTPPSTIRVLEYSEHTSSGGPVPGSEIGIFSVPFETYVRDVLPNEWIASWRAASLESGAMAVKTYGWYWVNHWRGGSYNGTCYNVDDSIDYQRYIPGQSAASTDAAVAATWGTVMTRSGAIFQASFQATLTGDAAEACGSGRSNYPDTLSQWGSQNCAGDGDSWQKILGVYYPGIALSAKAHSALAMNAAGTDVAFVSTNGQVVHDWATSTGWHGPAAIGGSARADSPIVENAAGTVVAFIATNGKVVDDWATSTGWKGPAATGGTARAGSALAMNAAGTDIVFANSGGAVVNDWGTSTGWKGPAGVGGSARADSPIVENDAGDHVMFINTKGAVVNDWATSTGWKGPSAIGGTARPGSSLSADTAGTDVAFVNTTGQVVHDWAAASGWKGPAAVGGTAATTSAVSEDGIGHDIVFANASNHVVHDWAAASGWKGPAGIGGTDRAGSPIAENDAGDHVMFLDAGGHVVNDWATSTGWKGPTGIGGIGR